MQIERRVFLRLAGAGLAGLATGAGEAAGRAERAQRRRGGDLPNFIVILCDDLGYGDLGCYGSAKHRTARIDAMAAEGMRLMDFYATSGVCTPSRASLMTGCYAQRVGLHMSDRNECVLYPAARSGLHPDETTIAEVLKEAGYATACIGKWHVGDQPPFLPTNHGFDYYYGLPYSNDMSQSQRKDNPPLPLLRNMTVIEAPADQSTLTRRYTDEALRFIRANRNRPFFLYLPHSMPHNPIHAGDAFRGKSANGVYGDAVQEIDASTGEILDALRALGLDEQTLVVLTSDNGAEQRWGGSNVPLSGWKGTTSEGGMRVPCIVRWPGRVPAGSVCREVATTMDFLPTFAKLAGLSAPADRAIDGKEIIGLITGQPRAESAYEAFYYYLMDQLQAIRSGRWKLHLALETTKRSWGRLGPERTAALFDLENDRAERKNLADQYPTVVKELLSLAAKARKDLGDLGARGAGQRGSGWVQWPKPLVKAP